MRQHERNYLFSDGDLTTELRKRSATVVSEVSKIPADQFLATSIDTLVENIVGRHAINPLVLHEEHIAMEPQEARIDVTGRFEYGQRDSGRTFTNGHQLSFYIPFTGDVHLWHLKANLSFTVSSVGTIDPQSAALILQLQGTSNTDPAQYQRELDSELGRIRKIIQAQATLIAEFHREIPALVRAAIEKRRNELEKLNNLTSAFNIPLVRKAGMPGFSPIEMPRKVVRPLPTVPRTGYKPEPAINAEAYEQILGIIRHTGVSLEGTPQTFMSMGEEGLRDIVLSHINASFEGAATAETFRKYGKTDIRIEDGTRAAFVGECKVWGGEKVLIDALGQLLDYLTWRDCKAALIVFNKDVAGFSEIQNTVTRALPTHPNFLRAKETGKIGEWRYDFTSSEDSAREVTVHVFMFNLYVKPERATKKR